MLYLFAKTGVYTQILTVNIGNFCSR